MVVIGCGLGAVYCILDTFIYLFLSNDFDFTNFFLGPDNGQIFSRLVALCLFLVFGSHAQFTIEKLRSSHRKLLKYKSILEKEVEKQNADLNGSYTRVEKEIVERKKAENELFETKEYIENIISSMNSSLVVTDPELTISLTNKATCELLNYSESELIGKPIENIFYNKDLFINTLHDKLLSESSVKNYETLYKTSSGEKIPVIFLSSIMYKDGKDRRTPTGIICVAQNISHLKQTKEELMNTFTELERTKDMLVQSEKLAAIGRLSAGISHEILNPINIISMRLQLLEMTEKMTEQGKSTLSICENQLERVVKITKDLGQFSRFHEKYFKVNDINKIITHILVLCGPQFKVDGVNTDIQYHPDLPLVPVDKDRIEQVLFNIVSNAVASMTGKGEKNLKISTELSSSGKNIQIKISDSGTGINPDDATKIFDPFYTTKDPDQGTGLGLFISYSIIEDHGGEIKVENNEIGGVSFIIELPIERKRKND